MITVSLMAGCSSSSGTAEESNDTEEEVLATVYTDAAEMLTEYKTTQYFTDDAVDKADIDQILAAGINTTSAMNGQPWHFTAVTDSELLQQIADGMSAGMPSAASSEQSEDTISVQKAGIADAPLAIIVSCAEGSDLDAGLATQSMFIEARLLGYGAKIISSPTMVLNGDEKETYQELLDIPEDYSVVSVLLVGYEDTSIDTSIDSVTGASVRNDASEVVSYVEP